MMAERFVLLFSAFQGPSRAVGPLHWISIPAQNRPEGQRLGHGGVEVLTLSEGQVLVDSVGSTAVPAKGRNRREGAIGHAAGRFPLATLADQASSGRLTDSLLRKRPQSINEREFEVINCHRLLSNRERMRCREARQFAAR
jgi:hypothetical protein